jgi:predicted SnoaL-like aldol condensation-catalyzing enzyme
MESIKEIALDFLRLTARGDSREAFRLYASPGFKHHNVWFKGDGETLMAAMEESARMNPEKIFEVQRALEDDDLVAVHSFVRQNPQDRGVAVVHIFRFEADKIAELWDFGQPVPEQPINENGMF